MAACARSVAVDNRILIHCAKLKQQSFSRRDFRKINRAEVPQIFVRKELALYAGCLALR